MRPLRKLRQSNRRGAVTVEFAFVAPLYATVFAGLTQVCYLLQVQNQFAMAAREGARAAVYEKNELGIGDQSTNEKVIEDVRKFLNANGLPGDDVDVYISEPFDTDTSFDLDDPDNDLRYFQVAIEYAADELMSMAPPGAEEFKISSRIVFRNGRRAAIVQ